MITFILLFSMCLYLYLLHRASEKCDITNNLEINAKFTEQELALEKSVRKHWFYTFLFSFILETFIVFISIGGLFLSPEKNFSVGIIFVFMLACLSYAVSYLFFYCSFLKLGTTWLLLMIIGIPFSILGRILELSQEHINFEIAIISILSIAIDAYFWFNCLKLRGFNSKRWKIKMGLEVYP